MGKINLKLRLKNKVTLIALFAFLVSFVYTTLGIFNIIPPISENNLIELFGELINVLVLLGIVVDPTTEGVNDSARAMSYDNPRNENDDICMEEAD